MDIPSIDREALLKRVAVVILNWNGEKLLNMFLPSVIENSKGAAIYVIDNNSQDGSISIIKESYKKIKIIPLHKNLGYAGGYNKGLEKVVEEFVILLNSDVEVTPNWIYPIVSKMVRDKGIGVIMPKILSYRDKTKFDYAGASGGYIDFLGYPFCRGRIFSVIEEDNGQYDTETEVFWASGAAFFIRKELFERVGGFDDNFFAHMEEIDLCWRLKNLGYKVLVVPESKVYHLGGGTLENTSPKKTYLNFRNNLLMLYRNLPFKYLILVLFLRLFLDIIAAVTFLLQRKYKFFVAVIKAHLHFYRRVLFSNKLIRYSFPKDAHINKKGLYVRSIVFSFYVLKRKHKSRLTRIL